MKTAFATFALAALLAQPQAALAQNNRHGPKGHSGEVQQSCPPGLAKKSPRCVPPGLAKNRHDDRRYDDGRYQDHRHDDDRYDDHHHYDPTRRDYRDHVGYRIDERFVLVPYPYRYRLDPAYDYYRHDGYVFRVDRDTREILDLIGAVSAILN